MSYEPDQSLSPSGQIVRDVLVSCIASMRDLSQQETVSIAKTSICDLAQTIARELEDPALVRQMTDEMVQCWRAHLEATAP